VSEAFGAEAFSVASSTGTDTERQSMQVDEVRITGSVRVEGRTQGRAWIAAFVQANGRKTRRALGLAWGARLRSHDETRRDDLARWRRAEAGCDVSDAT
jgi:hypothetical protein